MAAPAGGGLAALKARLAAEKAARQATNTPAQATPDTYAPATPATQHPTPPPPAAAQEPPAAVQRLKAQLEASDGEKAALQQRVSTLESKLAEASHGHSAAVSALEARAKAAEARLALATSTAAAPAPLGDDGSTTDLAAEVARLQKANAHLERQAARMRQHLLDKEEEDAARTSAEDDAAEERRRAAVNAARGEVDADLRAQRQRADDADAQVASLQDAVNERDTEIANLQRALGALTAEAERGERQRRELAHARAEVRQLQATASAATQDAAVCRSRVDEAQRAVERATHEAAEFRNAALAASQNEARARRALDEALAKRLGRDQASSGAVDQRVAMQVLLALFERRLADDVVALALKVFGAGDAEAARARAAVASLRSSGVLGTVGAVVGAPLSLVGRGVKSIVGGVTGVGPVGELTDEWVRFLEESLNEGGGETASEALREETKAPVTPIAPVPAVPQSGLADIPLG